MNGNQNLGKSMVFNGLVGIVLTAGIALLLIGLITGHWMVMFGLLFVATSLIGLCAAQGSLRDPFAETTVQQPSSPRKAS
jgi:hypothetical protein